MASPHPSTLNKLLQRIEIERGHCYVDMVHMLTLPPSLFTSHQGSLTTHMLYVCALSALAYSGGRECVSAATTLFLGPKLNFQVV